MIKQNFPDLRFRLNKTLDKKVCLIFLEHKKAGVDFGSGIIRLHPKLSKAKDFSLNQKRNLIDKYVDDFYQHNKKKLDSALQKAEKQWGKKEKHFSQLANKIFKHPWPKGEYIAYLSIFNCNPRFLKTKTFQFFWQHPRSCLSVISHEMLHFLFYDYIEKNVPETKNIPKQNIWALSEVINYFILSSSIFKNLFSQNSEPLYLYPGLQELAKKLLPIWKTSKDFKKFLSSTILWFKNLTSNNKSD